jgi:hypothetical protein
MYSRVAAQPTVVPDNHMVETLAPEGTDQAFGERILPGRVGRGDDFLDAEGTCGPQVIPYHDVRYNCPCKEAS